MFKNFFKKKVLPVVTAGVILTSFTPVSNAALGDQVLDSGMSSPDIKVLQEELKSLGHFKIQNTTNYYGFFTELAVRNFQLSSNLESTGVYDEATHKALEKAKLEQIEELKENGTILTYTRDLKLHNKGQDVNALQNKLKEIGFLKINNTTNYYGNSTREAVELFQMAYNLKADGIFDQTTLDTLNKVLLGDLEVKAVPKKPTPKPEAKPSKSTAIVNTAKKFQGRPYSYGANGPNSFDCSGFTSYVFRQNGINLPRTSYSQARVGRHVPKSQLRAGDLVVFNNYGHVGIYIGGGQFIHASTSRGVIIHSLNMGYYSRNYTTARRVL